MRWRKFWINSGWISLPDIPFGNMAWFTLCAPCSFFTKRLYVSYCCIIITAGRIEDEAEAAYRKTFSLTRLNDVLWKTWHQEAKQEARTNDFILSSERAEFKAFPDGWEKMGLTARNKWLDTQGEGEGENIFFILGTSGNSYSFYLLTSNLIGNTKQGNLKNLSR